jgi:selenide,water dikinase
MKRLVLLGGGHAHVHVLKAVGEALDSGVGVTLITPVQSQVYSGMVPGYLAGHYTLQECSIALTPLAQRARALIVRASGVRVDPRLREVTCSNGQTVAYDVLSIDIGSRPFVGDAKGVAEHAIPVRPLEDFVAAWERVLQRVREGSVGSVTVVGGGAAGIEVAFAMDHRFRIERGADAPHVRVVTNTPAPVMEYSGRVRERLTRLAKARNVGVHVNATVAQVGPGFVRLADNIEFASDATFWVAGAAAPALLRDSGLQTDARGFLAVNDFMQSLSAPEVFGAGDCATNVANPRAKAGVFAVRAGPALSLNLLAALKGGPFEHHVTPERFLALISCGERYAVGVYGPLSFEGRWVWRWKDRIDRRFLANYSGAAP